MLHICAASINVTSDELKSRILRLELDVCPQWSKICQRYYHEVLEQHNTCIQAATEATLTFSAMASPTASAACVVDFRLFENPRQPAEMHDWTRPFVSDSVMMVLLFELMIETIPACRDVTPSEDPCRWLR